MAEIADGGLRAIRDLLLVYYSEGLLNDEEFLVLYDANYSREIYPYWKFSTFDLSNWDDTRCRAKFRFAKNDLEELLNVLRFPIRYLLYKEPHALEWKDCIYC